MLSTKNKNLFLIISLIVLSSQNLSAQPVHISKKMNGISLSNNMMIYEDKTRELTIEDIIKNNIYFKDIKEVNINLDSKSYFWIKLNVDNSLDENMKWLLVLEDVWTDRVEIYQKVNQSYTTRRGGDIMSFNEREVSYRKNAFNINTNSNSSDTLYLKIWYEYVDMVNFDMKAYTPKDFNNLQSNEYIILGLIYGILIIFAIFNLILYFSFFNRNYLYFTLYLIANILLLLYFYGIGYQYIWSGSPYISNIGVLIFWNFIILSAIKMMQYFLEIQKIKKMNTFVDVWLGVTAFILIFVLTGLYKISFYLLYLSSFGSVSFIIFSFIFWRRGMNEAKLFFWGWLVFFTGLVVVFLRDFGFIAAGSFSEWAYAICLITQSTFISIALPEKIKILRREKEKYLLEKQEILQKSKEDLEIQVEKRTLELKESEHRYRTLLDSSPDAVAVHSEGKLIYINPMGLEFLAAENENQVIGKPIEMLIHPDYIDTVVQRLKLAAENPDQVTTPKELKFLRFDGKIIDLESVSICFIYERKPAFLSIFRDITERKRVERLREDTERMIKHDLKNPLAGIVGFSEFLIDKDMPQNVRAYASNIHEAGRQLLDMLESSMDFFKMEEGTFLPQKEKIDIAKILNEINEEFIPFQEKKSIFVLILFNGEIFSEKNEYTFIGQKVHIKNMFRNIIKNAIEASPNERRVTITIYDKNDKYEINVHNYGVVPEIIRERFFERYVTSGKESGTGLGTYSALLIAKAHQGDIAFTTSEEEGTRIVITLPKKPAEPV